MSGQVGGPMADYIEDAFHRGDRVWSDRREAWLERFVFGHDENEGSRLRGPCPAAWPGHWFSDISQKIMGNHTTPRMPSRPRFSSWPLGQARSCRHRLGRELASRSCAASRVGARSDAARRAACERRIAEMTQTEVEPSSLESGHDFEMLHEEVERLPRKYRDAVVLCYLEG